MKRVAILQSNYLPWKGYFDLIAQVDEFIVYDCAQYTKNDWRNRNQIKSTQGKTWLTVPVRHHGLGQPIDEVAVADPTCFRKHWATFRQTYAKAPHIDFCTEKLRPLFDVAAGFDTISAVNLHFLGGLTSLLGWHTRINSARNYHLVEGRNERLVELCRQASATHYLSGPAARSYLDEAAFGRAGITVEWADYAGYPEYPQPYPPFDHFVSILDLFAGTGERAVDYLKGPSGAFR
ncbi:WbqC family protein [Lysobacter sp. F6437]|uniref:WbqC family protein n=1 Tax=Lysobacter sp. F6437 TaxID=3459296 RepID=UPI00403DBEAF